MRFSKLLLVLLALALVAGGVFFWWLPAGVGYRYGVKYLGPVALSGVRGTVWDGHADGVSVFGRDLGEIDWRAERAALLRGRFVADIRIRGADVDVAGQVTRSGGGGLSARDLRFSVPAEALTPLLGTGTVKLLGTISGVVDQATLAGALLRDASGTARWSSAGVSGEVEMRFSDILAEFASRPDGSIAGAAHDDGSGDLAVDGTFALRLGAFDADAALRPRNGNAQVAELLRRIGEPQPDGSTRLAFRAQMLAPF
jgi:hypothetical protein